MKREGRADELDVCLVIAVALVRAADPERPWADDRLYLVEGLVTPQYVKPLGLPPGPFDPAVAAVAVSLRARDCTQPKSGVA